MEYPIHAGFDNPSLIDWNYNDVIPADYGGATLSNNDLLKQKLKIFSQYKNQKTMNGCGFYGLVTNLNAQKILEDSDWGVKHQDDPADRWIYWNEKERPEGQRWRGTGLQANMSYFRSKGWLTGWAVCRSIDEIKRALDNGDLIYTGADRCDWTKTYKTGTYTLRTDKKIVGHIFFIIGHDDKGLIAWDSNGPKYGPFTIPYNMISTLFSRNAVFGTKHADLITKYRAMNQFEQELQTAIAQKITNGERPNETTTRAETAVMVLRGKEAVVKELKEYIDIKFQDIVDMMQGSK